jgi:hypothetical protein
MRPLASYGACFFSPTTIVVSNMWAITVRCLGSDQERQAPGAARMHAPGASAHECSAWRPALALGKMMRLNDLSDQRLVPSPWKSDRAIPE